MPTLETTRKKSARKTTAKKTAKRSGSTAKKRSAISRAGGGVVNAIMRRLDVSSIGVKKLEAESINVGRIELGDASVDNMELTDLTSNVTTGSARLMNVRSVVSINLSLDWRVRLPFVRDPRGTIGPIGLPVPFKLGNVDVDDIDPIQIEVPSATVTGVEVEIQPITNFSFNGGSASAIDLSTMQLPANGFAISGLSYDAFDLSHVGLPDGTIANAKIGELAPNGELSIPSVEVRNVQIPSVEVPTVESTSPINVENATSDVVPSIPIDLGILVLTIRVTPTMDLNIERLELADMQAASSIDKITLQNIASPVLVKDVTVGGINLDQVTVNQVSL